MHWILSDFISFMLSRNWLIPNVAMSFEYLQQSIVIAVSFLMLIICIFILSV
jgi:hypothetical protein